MPSRPACWSSSLLNHFVRYFPQVEHLALTDPVVRRHVPKVLGTAATLGPFIRLADS